MKKTAVILIMITIISKILGFARELVLSYYYGASYISDAFFISQTIPVSVFGIIVTGLSTGYIPMYSNIEEKYGTIQANRYTSNLVNILMIVCSLAVIGGLCFTEQLVKVFASGFKGEGLALAVTFTRISIFGIYFTVLISIYNGFLQLRGRHVITALVGVPLNIIIILSIFISARTSEIALVIGNLVATGFQVIFLLAFVKSEGYKYEFIINFKDEKIKRMVYIALPAILGSSANQVNILIDKTIASNIAIGGISALNYSGKLSDFILGLFVVTIVTIIFPSMSRMAAQKNINGLKKSISEAINTINILIVPATVGLMIFAEPFVRLLFNRGAFTENSISMTSNALYYYSIGTVGYGIRRVLSNVFYSLQDTRTPMTNSIISIIMNLILNIILSKYMGIGGLALASSISAIISTILLYISLRKKIGSFGGKSIAISFIKIAFASLVMGIISIVSYTSLLKVVDVNISLIISVMVSVIAYFVIIYFVGLDEITTIIEEVKKKFK